jgi:hypothetical protein
LTVKGAVTAGKLNINPQDPAAASIGTAHVVAGQTQVVVPTAAVTANSKIFVTATTRTGQALSVTTQETGKSFTVEALEPEDKDVYFNWWIIN